ncbi:MAG: hypothetical protein L0J17_01610 [Brevibacterium sp.]|uniref:hypothetical protein n=1 Tax=Brevibacterium sp. TaxID=1701 RepID=UPI00264A148A|nr:hypothetical protein [Brevibacterium sp.]MDN5806976.1 hypothetical protein [Brevibacterium sp.]MDN5832456.1 hypothetical protein [Brevibacterium sp.]MDN5875059.1 hypothetical protein [Brevibacterium sp.]MDN5908812.1 hypothetical protein [Brevibacterium sp.]MDN6133095.1 hypothetical protein [Brevibacterium sp.]
MEAMFHLRDYSHEHLTELTLDGLLTRLTESTWIRKGAVLSAEDRMAALHAQIPPRLVLSHDIAWWVHSGLGRAPSPLTFITYPRRRYVDGCDIVVHELTIAPDEWELINDHPITTAERTLYDLLLPHLRCPDERSAQAVKNLIDELPGRARHRFRLYLAEVSRRPYVAHMRTAFERACAASDRDRR